MTPLPLASLPATLDDAIAAVATVRRLDPEALRRLRSDVATATKLVHLSRADRGVIMRPLPCDPVELRPLLRLVLPARHGRHAAKRWGNVKSQLIFLLKLVGWHETDDMLQAPPSEPWRRLRDQLPRA